MSTLVHLKALRRALDMVQRDFTRIIEALITNAYDPEDRDASIATLVPMVSQATRTARAQAYRHASSFLRTQAQEQGVMDPYIPEITPYSDDAVKTVLTRTLRGNRNEAREATIRALHSHIEQAARDVPIRAVEDGRPGALHPAAITPEEWEEATGQPAPDIDPDEFEDTLDDIEDDTDAEYEEIDYALERGPAPSAATYQKRLAAARARGSNTREKRQAFIPMGTQRPTSWVRVLTGADNCAFCIMLASRGPTYTTAERAGALVVSREHTEAGVTHYVNSYHPGCDCMVVPVYGRQKWPGYETYKEAEKLYTAATGTEWVDDKGKKHYEIRADYGPSKTKKSKNKKVADRSNQVLLEMERQLRRRKKEGKTLDIPDLRY